MKIIRANDKSFVPASHENPLAPGVWKKVLFQRDELQHGTVQMVNWARLPVGNSFSAHYHEDMQEIFIIVAGEAEMVVEGETAVLGRGHFISSMSILVLWPTPRTTRGSCDERKLPPPTFIRLRLKSPA